jgi:hypothetical protein
LVITQISSSNKKAAIRIKSRPKRFLSVKVKTIKTMSVDKIIRSKRTPCPKVITPTNVTSIDSDTRLLLKTSVRFSNTITV